MTDLYRLSPLDIYVVFAVGVIVGMLLTLAVSVIVGMLLTLAERTK
jgi:hypothetical protein